MQYLWQRDRRSLLNEMIDAGLRAVLVKVSGGGLEPRKHLGKDLASLMPAFDRLSARFGLDICGEGGEYESMVIDCPVFRCRLDIERSELVEDPSDATVGHLKVQMRAIGYSMCIIPCLLLAVQIIEYRVVPKDPKETQQEEAGAVGVLTAIPVDTAVSPALFQHTSEPASCQELSSHETNPAPSAASSISVGRDGLGSTGLVARPSLRSAEGALDTIHAEMLPDDFVSLTSRSCVRRCLSAEVRAPSYGRNAGHNWRRAGGHLFRASVCR